MSCLFKIKRKRKGFFYTLFVVIMFVLIVSNISMLRESTYEFDNGYEIIRNNEMAYFVEGVFEDIERSALISGKLSVIAIANYEIENGSFVNSSNTSLITAMLNGTYDGNNLKFIENSTLQDWYESIKILAEGLSYDIEIDINNITLMQKDNFKLNITIDTNILIVDSIVSAAFDKNLLIAQEISINNTEDSFNTVLSKGFIYQQYNICNYIEGLTSSVDWKYGIAYVDNTTTNYTGFSFGTNNMILIRENISKVDDFAGKFIAVIGQTNDNTGALNYIANATNASNLIANGSIIVLDNNKIWLTNLTIQTKHSCFFEAKNAPCFLDRMENSSVFSSKYLPGNRGIGSFINIVYFPLPMQNVLAEGIGDYKLDWKYYPV